MRAAPFASVLLAALLAVPGASAQRPRPGPAAAPAGDSAVKAAAPADTVPDSSVTFHTLRIGGQTMPLPLIQTFPLFV